MYQPTSPAPMAIAGALLLPREGIIEGAVIRTAEMPTNLPEAFMLPDEGVMEVEAGTAFLIKSGSGHWLLVQFFRPGRMSGPLVFAAADIETPEKALRNSLPCFEALFSSSFLFCLGIAMLFMPPAIMWLNLVAGIGMSFIFALLVWRYARALWVGGRHAVDLLYKDQKTPTMRVPIGTIRGTTTLSDPQGISSEPA